MVSYWERQTYFSSFDLLIVGGGLVGLSTALSASKINPSIRIGILDKGAIPTGASTKNAGFGCFGSPTELLDDLQHMDEEQVWRLVRKRWQGLHLLREEVGDQALCLESHGGYEVFLEADREAYEQVMQKIDVLNARFQDITGVRRAILPVTPSWQGSEMQVEHVISLPLESQLNPAKMIRALQKKCVDRGIELFQGVEVMGFQPKGADWDLKTQPDFPFKTKRLLMATNGFTRQLLPELEVQPARNQVLITAPLIGFFTWKGCFHYKQGYAYFRNVGDRILLGGFRHVDSAGEQTAVLGLTDRIQNFQEQWLQQVLLPGAPVEIDCRWSGILGVGAEKEPILKELAPGLWASVRLGGMGVALGSLLGKEAAESILA